MTDSYIAVQRASTLPTLDGGDFDEAELIVHVPLVGLRKTTQGAIRNEAVAAALLAAGLEDFAALPALGDPQEADQIAGVRGQTAGRLSWADLKAAAATPRQRRVITGPTTLSNADFDRLLIYAGDDLVTLTVPAGLRQDFGVAILQVGTGGVRIAAPAGVAIRNAYGHNGPAGPYALAALLASGAAANEYVLSGVTGLVALPDAPVITSTGPFEISEGAEVGAYVGYVAFTGATGLAITAGDPDGRFAVDLAAGEITLAAALDYETAQSYTLTITATNAAGSASADVVVDVLDVAPVTVVAGQRFGVFENAAVGTAIGTLRASRPVTSIAITGGPFAADADGTLRTTAALSFADTPTYALSVTATDAEGASAPAAVTVDVIAAGEAYAPLAAGALAYWQPSNTGFRTLTGDQITNLRNIGGLIGFDFPQHPSGVATTNPRPTLATGAGGINGVDALRVFGNQALYAASGAALKSIVQNKALFAIEAVIVFDDPSVSNELLRFTTVASNTSARWALRQTLVAGASRLQLSCRRLDADAAVTINHGLDIQPGVPYYIYAECNYQAGTTRVIVNSDDQINSVIWPSGTGPTQNGVSAQGFLGFSNSVPSYFRLAELAAYDVAPTEAARVRNQAILRARYGIA